jgi:hypothetical protein
MPRITISIPRDLQHRLADPLVRKSLNVSRVCQQALKREVNRLLDLPLDLERMEKILLRLREQHQVTQARWSDAGAAAARDWVEHAADYLALKGLGQASLSTRIGVLRATPSESLAAALARHRTEADFDEEAFLQGWAVAVGLLWEALQDKL